MMRAAMLLFGAATVHLLGATHAAHAEGRKPLPPGFVYLKDIDPTIVQDIRYATPFNFTGAPVQGYGAAECVLLREVALALKDAQEELRLQNLGLKVYDCYRPQRAVRAFVDWVRKPDSKGDDRHYPRTQRSDLVKLGYISAASNHSYGTAVDLTLIALPSESAQARRNDYAACVAPKDQREPDESLDMGTGFDCFDLNSRNPALLGSSDAEAQKSAEKPELAAPPLEIQKDQRDRRLQLFTLLKAHGFKGIGAEWWHYQYTRIPRPLKPQDFAIPAAEPRSDRSGRLRSGARPSS